MKRLIIILLTPLFCYSQDIHPNKTGGELRTLLVQDYKPNQVLTYAMARDTLFKNIYRDQDGFVSCFYSGHSIYLPDDINPRFHLAMNGDDSGINNCEHIFPQSKGADDGNARSDMHHLVPARWAINEARSNYPFADVPDDETDHWYRLETDLTSIPIADIDEYSERLNGGFGNSGEFEPRKSVKGDIARSVFYFYTMYRDEADSADPDFFDDMLPTLIDWHHVDPVSEDETRITNQKANYQEDKPNPYVLDCTLVSRAFGGQSYYETASTKSYDYRPKRYLYPNPVEGHISIYGMRIDADQIRITTLEGELIQTINNPYMNQVDVSGYMPGTYILKLRIRLIDKFRNTPFL